MLNNNNTAAAQPLPWQQRHIDEARQQLNDPRWGCVRRLLALDTGLGKTFIAAFICRDVLPDEPVLVVAPLATLGGWEEKWRAVEPERPIYVVDQRKSVDERIKWACSVYRKQPNAVVIINHHTMSLATAKQLRLLTKYVSVGVLDEAHVAKNYKTRAAKRLVGQFSTKHRLALTATPIEQRPSQLWTLLAWLRPDIYGWGKDSRGVQRRSYWHFAKAYEHWETVTIGQRSALKFAGVKQEKLPALHKELEATGVFVRVKKEDVQTLPPLNVVAEHIPPSPKQRELYDDLATELLAIDAGGRVMAVANGASLMTRLRQVEEGAFHFGFTDEENPKLERLRAILNEVVRRNRQAKSASPVVVFTPFVITTDWLEERLREDGYTVDRITGQETAEEKSEAVRALNSGEVDVLIATYGAGGEGIDLIGSHTMVAWGLPWSYIQWSQSVDRLHRTGQKHPVIVYVLRSTPMAYVVWNLLQRKENVSEAALVAALKQQSKEESRD